MLLFFWLGHSFRQWVIFSSLAFIIPSPFSSTLSYFRHHIVTSLTPSLFSWRNNVVIFVIASPFRHCVISSLLGCFSFTSSPTSFSTLCHHHYLLCYVTFFVIISSFGLLRHFFYFAPSFSQTRYRLRVYVIISVTASSCSLFRFSVIV